MKLLSPSRLCCLAVLTLVCGVAQAAPAPEKVSVHYRDPGNFTEAKLSFGVNARNASAYLIPLKAYIEQRATRILAPGQRLVIEVTDVDRAGEYEPWRGPDFSTVRIIKDVYPPRIDLNFTLYGADGKILREGNRSLRDVAFLGRVQLGDSDTLRYEKSLIDRWLRKGTGDL